MLPFNKVTVTNKFVSSLLKKKICTAPTKRQSSSESQQTFRINNLGLNKTSSGAKHSQSGCPQMHLWPECHESNSGCRWIRMVVSFPLLVLGSSQDTPRAIRHNHTCSTKKDRIKKKEKKHKHTGQKKKKKKVYRMNLFKLCITWESIQTRRRAFRTCLRLSLSGLAKDQI